MNITPENLLRILSFLTEEELNNLTDQLQIRTRLRPGMPKDLQLQFIIRDTEIRGKLADLTSLLRIYRPDIFNEEAQAWGLQTQQYKSETLNITTNEVLRLIESRNHAPIPLGRAFLGSLVGILQWEVLQGEQHNKASQNHASREDILYLNRDFAPDDQSNKEISKHISEEIGLDPIDTLALLGTFRDMLTTKLNEYEAIDFEPLGIITINDHGMYKIHLKQNFIPALT